MCSLPESILAKSSSLSSSAGASGDGFPAEGAASPPPDCQNSPLTFFQDDAMALFPRNLRGCQAIGAGVNGDVPIGVPVAWLRYTARHLFGGSSIGRLGSSRAGLKRFARLW